MLYQNFEIFPIGNANLQITPAGILSVSNVGSGGYDGIMVDVSGRPHYQINFNEIPSIINGGVMQVTTKAKNSFNQTVTVDEKITWFDSQSNMVKIGYNAQLLPKNFRVIGKLNGNDVFDIPFINPVYDNNKPSFIIEVLAVVAIGVAVWAALRTKKYKEKHYIYDNNGKITGYTIVHGEDPTPFEVTVQNQNFIVDEFLLIYDVNLDKPIDPGYALNDTTVCITGCNLNTFEINSIQ